MANRRQLIDEGIRLEINSNFERLFRRKLIEIRLTEYNL